MKRHKDLYPRIHDWGNLVRAYHKARKGKRSKPNVATFELNWEQHLLGLEQELREGSWQPGAYRTFWIHDPKTRPISAAPFRDRVVHHAICNVIEPVFEPTFIHDSYACRPRGAGFQPAALAATPAAPGTAAGWATCATGDRARKRHPCRGGPVHGVQPEEPLRAQVRPPQVLSQPRPRDPAEHSGAEDWLPADASSAAADRGVQQPAGTGGGVLPRRRPVHPARAPARPPHRKPDQSVLRQFLGYRIWPTHRRLRRDSVLRFKRRRRHLRDARRAGDTDLAHVRASVASWTGHAQHADTWRLRGELTKGFVW